VKTACIRLHTSEDCITHCKVDFVIQHCSLWTSLIVLTLYRCRYCCFCLYAMLFTILIEVIPL